VIDSDAQVLAVLLQACADEVAIGQVGFSRAEAAPLRDFASRMINEHAAAEQRLQAAADRVGLQVADNDLRRRVAQQGGANVGSLMTVPPAGFDSAFARVELSALQSLLLLLDTQILPIAQSPELRAEVMALRVIAIQELAAAHALASMYGGASSG
jgi:putative membrane protein